MVLVFWYAHTTAATVRGVTQNDAAAIHLSVDSQWQQQAIHQQTQGHIHHGQRPQSQTACTGVPGYGIIPESASDCQTVELDPAVDM